MPQELIGQQLDRYRIDRYIASGGMADVYQAQDTETDKTVALKILPPEYARNQEMVERFHREARSAGALRHPNIVRIYGEGIADNLHYIAMEYVAGKTLKDRLTEHGSLLPQRVLNITTQICHALNYAHARGVVHRDIKPANIMVDQEDNVIITDFGIAKAADSTQLTSTGTAMGTPEYMSPEQIQGDTDFRTDIYSLGIVMYEMLTGRVPFRADTPIAVAYKHTHERPIPPRQIAPHTPRELESIIMKALEKDPDNRYPDIQAMYNDLPKEVRMTVPPQRISVESMPGYEKDRETTEPIRSPIKLIAVLLLITLAGLSLVAYFTLLTGYLTVESSPVGATVWINGKMAGETPLSKRVLAGAHHIKIGKGGYGFFEQADVEVQRRNTARVFGKLPALIRSSPSGAEVYINGELKGKTPLSYDFASGQYTLRLKRVGYEDRTKSLIASDQAMRPLPILEMAKIPERYSVKILSTPGKAQIVLNGKKSGFTPKTIELPTGRYHVYLMRRGYQSSQGFIKVPENLEYQGTLKQLQAYGKLAVNALPFGSVYLDGELKGETPLMLDRVLTGMHRLRITRSGFREIVREVAIEPDATTRVGIQAEEWVAADE